MHPKKNMKLVGMKRKKIQLTIAFNSSPFGFSLNGDREKKVIHDHNHTGCSDFLTSSVIYKVSFEFRIEMHVPDMLDSESAQTKGITTTNPHPPHTAKSYMPF